MSFYGPWSYRLEKLIVRRDKYADGLTLGSTFCHSSISTNRILGGTLSFQIFRTIWFSVSKFGDLSLWSLFYFCGYKLSGHFRGSWDVRRWPRNMCLGHMLPFREPCIRQGWRPRSSAGLPTRAQRWPDPLLHLDAFHSNQTPQAHLYKHLPS